MFKKKTKKNNNSFFNNNNDFQDILLSNLINKFKTINDVDNDNFDDDDIVIDIDKQQKNYISKKNKIKPEFYDKETVVSTNRKNLNIEIISKVLNDIDPEFHKLNSKKSIYNDNDYDSKYFDKPEPRYNYAIYYVDEGEFLQVYIFGGCILNNRNQLELFNDFWKFDLKDRWQRLYFENEMQPRYNSGLVIISFYNSYNNITYHIPLIFGGVGINNKQFQEAYYCYPLNLSISNRIYICKDFLYPKNINSNLCNSLVYNNYKNTIMLFQDDCLFEFDFKNCKEWKIINRDFFTNNNIVINTYYFACYYDTVILITCNGYSHQYWYLDVDNLWKQLELEFIEFKSTITKKFNQNYVFYIYTNYYDDKNKIMYLFICDESRKNKILKLEIVGKSKKRKVSFKQNLLSVNPIHQHNIIVENEEELEEDLGNLYNNQLFHKIEDLSSVEEWKKNIKQFLNKIIKF